MLADLILTVPSASAASSRTSVIGNPLTVAAATRTLTFASMPPRPPSIPTGSDGPPAEAGAGVGDPDGAPPTAGEADVVSPPDR